MDALSAADRHPEQPVEHRLVGPMDERHAEGFSPQRMARRQP